ncbi:MAG: ester cyclase [Streptomyces sp.]|uniref:ester cyclase n=1 Tax=Streptomyces sp. TaxID=1931 RepID=UPI0025CBA515|nr:ester cyclase [Streptomyces sp.]MBW8795366.1 ester cyclase [Streptomyces sp.]
MDRRSVLTGGAAALGALAITAVSNGTSLAQAAQPYPGLLPDPATTPVPNPPFPHNLTHTERKHLETFDELDFQVFTHADWARLGESHAQNIRVHWPDGHYTDGIDKHIEDLSAMFVWAPDTRIESHPLRVAKNELTAVTGVMKGTFTRPMPDGKGGFIQPTGKKYAISMVTVGIWNRRGTMDEEFLFWDNQTFYQQIGLA